MGRVVALLATALQEPCAARDDSLQLCVGDTIAHMGDVSQKKAINMEECEAVSTWTRQTEPRGQGAYLDRRVRS